MMLVYCRLIVYMMDFNVNNKLECCCIKKHCKHKVVGVHWWCRVGQIFLQMFSFEAGVCYNLFVSYGSRIAHTPFLVQNWCNYVSSLPTQASKMSRRLRDTPQRTSRGCGGSEHKGFDDSFDSGYDNSIPGHMRILLDD